MSQARFARALLDPAAPLPPGLVDPRGRPAPARFAVYRNNVATSLTRALQAGFPTVLKLVGEEFFAAMARVFLRAHPPRSRVLMLYGDALPGFLAGFPPVAHLGYLPDVARLDLAMRESHHAADSRLLPEPAFRRLLEQNLAHLRLTLAPSLRLVRSDWPLYAIWAANHRQGPAPVPGPQDLLVLRPEFDPAPHLLPPGGARLVEGLLRGESLGDSLAAAGERADLAATLALLITGRAITGISA